MEHYHKINGIYKRYTEGKKKGRFIEGEWARPEFEFLAKNEWVFNEKIDGTSTVIDLVSVDYRDLEVSIGGRTPNSEFVMPLLEKLREIFPTYDFRGSASVSYAQNRAQSIIDWMNSMAITSATLYGEGVGAKVQGSGKYLDDYGFILFDVKVGNYWLKPEVVIEVADALGLNYSPILGTGTLQDAIDIVSSGFTFNKHGGIVRWGRNGLNSTFGEFESEGIIARPKVQMFGRNGERILTKIKGVDFK